jgi:tetratricopeptide (TPR) repeat protein
MLQAGSGFLSQHSKDVFFGLGEAQGPANASIRWPSGLVQELHDLPIDHRIWVEEGAEPSRMEPFKKSSFRGKVELKDAAVPATVETWLLTPVQAPAMSLPKGRPLLLQFAFDQKQKTMIVSALDDHSVVPIPADDDLVNVYNVLYRYIFDRHRDLTLPASFLIDSRGDIVKIYQGPVNPLHVREDFGRIPQNREQRLARALPFPGNAGTYEFGRNNLSFGSQFFLRGYYDQAEAAFQLAVQAEPSNAAAHYSLASVYLKQEKIAQARAGFETAVKLSAGNREPAASAWNDLGILATREGRLAEAAADFEEAVRLNPDYWIGLQNLGNAYRQQKRWDEARGAFERAVALRPQAPEPYSDLAIIYAQTGDMARAGEYWLKAVQLRPDYPEALNNLGILYLRTRRRDDAVAKFEECIRVAPEFDQAYLNLAGVYNREGTPDKARAVLLDLLQRHPGHAAAQQALDQLR